MSYSANNNISNLIIQWGGAGSFNTKQGSKTVNFATSFNHIGSVVVSSSNSMCIITRANITANNFTFAWRHIDGSTGSIAESSTSYIAVGY